MLKLSADLRLLADEHRLLVGRLGRVQRRCSNLLADQVAEIERLQGEVMRLRARMIAHESALAYAREDLTAGRATPAEPMAAVPLADACALADLREKAVLCIGRDESAARFTKRLVEMAGGQFLAHRIGEADDSAELEARLVAADLVICQSGCVSHNAYWRVQDHCRRTGKQCVLVDRPQALEILRHHRAAAVFASDTE